MKKETLIKNKTDWIRDIKPGQTKTAYVSSSNELDTISTLVSRFNKGVGHDRGVRIESHRDWEKLSYTITCYNI